MDEGKKIIIYTWKYDNGAWGYAVKQKKEGGWLEEESYATKREVEKCYKKYEEGPNGQSVKKKKIDVLVGLPCVEDRYKDKEKENWERSGMEAMCALLDSCGATPDAKREMLRFVASVLAGYCARVSAGYYMQFLSPLQRRAPIIFVKQAPFAGEVLERVVRSLALNTTCQRKRRDEIKCKYTPVLPMKASDEKITDRAFLKLEGRNKRMLPQYRDTTLMVYSWFLRGKDGKRLQLMNRWVSMVIYGASRNQVLTTPVEIEGKDLATSDCQWSVNDVQVSVIRYARYIFRKSNKTEKWGKMIETYLQKRQTLCGIILLIDIRHQPGKNDIMMYDWLKHYGYDIIIAATKADKLNKSQIPKHLSVIKNTLSLAPEDKLIAFSGTAKTGITELWTEIERLLQ